VVELCGDRTVWLEESLDVCERKRSKGMSRGWVDGFCLGSVVVELVLVSEYG
jgi:hypothetical protein